MPRKPGLPPMILRVEMLDTGLPPKAKPFVDDFSGEMVAPKGPKGEGKPLRSGQEIRDAQNRAKHARAKALLESVGILERTAPASQAQAQELIPKGKRKIAEISGKTVLVDNPPWRRV